MARLPRISIVGAGNIANHFGVALHNKGYQIDVVYSRKKKNAQYLAQKVNAEATTQIEEITPNSDIYFLWVPDSAIEPTAKKLAKSLKKKTALICHSSGATPISVFDSMNRKTLNLGVFYPLQSFTKGQAIAIKEVPILIESNTEQGLKELNIIAKKLSKRVALLNSEERLLFHLNAVIVNNFVNHLFCKSNQLLKAYDLEPNLLAPIVKSTFENLLEQKACKIQTGPAKRHDKKTIKQHLRLIQDDENLSKIYKQISKSIMANYPLKKS